MSIVHQWTKKGKIEYNGNTYDLLTSILDDDTKIKFEAIYKKYKDDDKLAMTTTSYYKNLSTSWSVIDDKLYLKELNINHVKDDKFKHRYKDDDGKLHISMGSSVNVLPEIFGENKQILATWVNQVICIKLSSTFKDGYEIFNELHLEVVDGIVTNKTEVQNKYKTLRSYVEE